MSLQQENNKRRKLNIIRNMVNGGQCVRQYHLKIHCVQDKGIRNEWQKTTKTQTLLRQKGSNKKVSVLIPTERQGNFIRTTNFIHEFIQTSSQKILRLKQ